MTIQIVPFHADLLPQAGALLAQRHQRDRVVFPLLPERFVEPSMAYKAIEAALQRRLARGFAAVDGNRLVAYLIGDLQIDEVWGRSGWVRLPGCAYASTVGVEIVRDLYAALGEHWVAHGVFFHFALLPIADPALIQAWFSLSFGIEQVHGLLDLETLNPTTPALPPEIEIRQAGLDDREHLAELSDLIWQVQVKAPVWGIMAPELVSDVQASWAGLVEQADTTIWLARYEGQIVGIQAYHPVQPTDENMRIPEQCIHLAIAGTRATARSLGIGTLLTQHGLAQAHAAGYRVCETDWRSTNLLSSRFWPRRGFQPTVYRLVRRIDQRILWADGPVG